MRERGVEAPTGFVEVDGARLHVEDEGRGFPVLLVHGRNDDTCPPPWARATHRALQQAGVESQLAWYDDGHAFGPAFFAAMDRTVEFFAASA